MDSMRSARNWIGAIYYRIILKESNGKKYYTLLGFDDYSINSNKKWMEVLTVQCIGRTGVWGTILLLPERLHQKALCKRGSALNTKKKQRPSSIMIRTGCDTGRPPDLGKR